jgi:hypothetical protein
MSSGGNAAGGSDPGNGGTNGGTNTGGLSFGGSSGGVSAGGTTTGGTAGNGEAGAGGVGGSEAGAGGAAGADGGPAPVRILFPPTRSFTDAKSLTVRGRTTDGRDVQSVRVNGVVATSTDGFATWSAQVPMVFGENRINVAVTDDEGRASALPDAARVMNNDVSLTQITAFTADAARNRVLIRQWGRSIVALDRATGRLSVLSDAEHGTGPALDVSGSMAWDANHNRIVVVNGYSHQVLALDPLTGNRTVLAQNDSGIGPQDSLVLDADGDFAYASTSDVVELNLTTGARRVLSASASVADSTLQTVYDSVYDDVTDPAKPRLLAGNYDGVYAVDLATGNRTRVAAAVPATGTLELRPTKLELDRAGRRLLVLNRNFQSFSIVALDLMNGERSLVAREAADVGTGARLELPVDIAAGGSGLFTVTEAGKVLEVDLGNLQRTWLAGGAGDGPGLLAPFGIAAAPSASGAQVYAVDLGRKGVVRMDTGSGNRSEVTSATLGSGPPFQSNIDITLDLTGTHAAPRALVLDNSARALIGVDLVSGARSSVAVFPHLGRHIVIPRKIVFDPVGERVFGADLGEIDTEGAVCAMDVVSGAVTLVSGDTWGGQPRGVGEPLGGGFTVGLDPGPGPMTHVMAGSDDSLLAVELATGNRSVVSSPTVGSGVSVGLYGDIAADPALRRVLAIDSANRRLVWVNRQNGQRTLLSGPPDTGPVRGTGPALMYLESLDVDWQDSVGYVLENTRHAVVAIDLISGDRVIAAQ